MNTEMFAEMTRPATEKGLKKATRFQGNMMPVGEWIIATRWAWNFEREAMGYQAFLYRYTTAERSETAPIHLAISSAEDHEDFTNQAETGAWAMGMILAN
jgi:hypothetical protein